MADSSKPAYDVKPLGVFLIRSLGTKDLGMLDKKIEAAINRQINHELAAAYNYYAMAAYFETLSLSGFADWMVQQRTEELDHAMRLYRYLLDRGGVVDFDAVSKPKATYSSVQDVFETALKQEEDNTAAINQLYKLAVECGDYTTQSALQWFLDEQVEEEKTMGEILDMVKFAGDDRSALLVLNRQVGERSAPEGN